MRPRVFPAEDARNVKFLERAHAASMRPRVFPAEDLPRAGAGGQRPPPRFNEAAGIPRGRRVLLKTFSGHQPASMRPRVFPAEDISFYF